MSPHKNLTKEIKDLYTENYKILIKLKMTQKKKKVFQAFGWEELLLKWQYYPKQSIDLMQP